MSVIFNEPGGGGSGVNYIQTDAPAATTAGELWLKPTDGAVPGTAGLWLSTGAYWVSPDIHPISLGFDSNGFTTTTYSAIAIGALPTRFGNKLPLVYVESVNGSAFVNTTADASNYWYFALFACLLSNISGAAHGAAAANPNGVTGLPPTGDATFRATVPNTEVDISKSIKAPLNYGVTPDLHTYALAFFAYKQGSPGALDYAHMTLNLRRLHP